jgi:hypothetical protein
LDVLKFPVEVRKVSGGAKNLDEEVLKIVRRSGLFAAAVRRTAAAFAAGVLPHTLLGSDPVARGIFLDNPYNNR